MFTRVDPRESFIEADIDPTECVHCGGIHPDAFIDGHAWHSDCHHEWQEEYNDYLDDEENQNLCPSCNGTGVSPTSNRPDDYGPHHVCENCNGRGM